MSISIDTAHFGPENKRVFDRVASSDPGITWAVLNYDIGTHVLELEREGAGSLDSFVECFEDSQIQYGFANIEFNNVHKVVLVGHVGEGVPDRFKQCFNTHFAIVAKTFPGHHVQFVSRSSDDLSSSAIVAKVEQSAGSNYSQSRPAPSTKPKYRAAADGANEDDWGDAKAIEVKDVPQLTNVPSSYKPLKVDISSRGSVSSSSTKSAVQGLDSSSSYKPVGKVDIAAIREAAKGSKFADTRLEKTESSYKPHGKVDIAAIRAAAKREEENKTKAGSQKEAPAPVSKPRAENTPRAENAPGNNEDEPQFGSLKDRMKAFNQDVQSSQPAFKSGGPQRRAEPRAAVKQASGSGTTPWSTARTQQQEPAPAQGFKNHGAENGKTPAQIWAEKHAKQPKQEAEQEPQHFEREESTFEASPEPVPEQDVRNIAAKFEQTAIEAPQASVPPQLPSRQSEPAKEPAKEPTPEPTPEVPAETEAESEAVSDLTAIVEEAYTPGDDGEDEIGLVVGEIITNVEKVSEFWWLGTNSKGEAGVFPAEYVRASDAEPPAQPIEQEEQEQIPEPQQSGPGPEQEESGIEAIAQFDYDADDDDELSFKAGDRITDVQFPSDDWWSGYLNGQCGLFPANFVTRV